LVGGTFRSNGSRQLGSSKGSDLIGCWLQRDASNSGVIDIEFDGDLGHVRDVVWEHGRIFRISSRTLVEQITNTVEHHHGVWVDLIGMLELSDEDRTIWWKIVLSLNNSYPSLWVKGNLERGHGFFLDQEKKQESPLTARLLNITRERSSCPSHPSRDWGPASRWKADAPRSG